MQIITNLSISGVNYHLTLLQEGKLQTFELSQFGCETHGFRSYLKVPQFSPKISQISTVNKTINKICEKSVGTTELHYSTKKLFRAVVKFYINKIPQN